MDIVTIKNRKLSINSGKREVATEPYKEGAWWYVSLDDSDGNTTTKKFSSQQEAKAWVKEYNK